MTQSAAASAKGALAALRNQLALGLAIGTVAFGLVAGARLAGGLERIELAMHDRLLDFQAGLPPQPDSVVIYETEGDLQRFGHPLSDERLADFLEKLEAMQPALVAVDKYRDLPIAPGSEQLDKVLTDNGNIFWVAKYGAAAFDGVRPPKILEGTARAACADIIVDSDLRVRRALVAIGEGERACPSLTYVMAASWLAAHGRQVGFDPQRDHALLLGETVLPRIGSWDGPYAGADASGYQIPLRYRRGPAVSFTLSQVLDGAVPAEAIRGKAVFFGSSATSLRDFFDVTISCTVCGSASRMLSSGEKSIASRPASRVSPSSGSIRMSHGPPSSKVTQHANSTRDDGNGREHPPGDSGQWCAPSL